MIGCTYSILRCHRDTDGEWEKVVDSDLDWETAKRKSEELNEAERKLHPNKTSWTRDLFFPQLEPKL